MGCDDTVTYQLVIDEVVVRRLFLRLMIIKKTWNVVIILWDIREWVLGSTVCLFVVHLLMYI